MRVVAANRAHGPHCYVSSANTEENHVLSDGDVEARRVLPGVEHADAARRVVMRRNRGAYFLWRRVDKMLLRSKQTARGSKRVQIWRRSVWRLRAATLAHVHGHSAPMPRLLPEVLSSCSDVGLWVPVTRSESVLTHDARME